MEQTVSAARQVLMPVTGIRIYKLADNRWQVVTPSSAMTLNCPEELLKGVVEAFGVQDADEVARKLADSFQPESVHDFIAALKSKELITTADQAQAAPLRDRLFHLFPRSPELGEPFRPDNHVLRIAGSGRTADELRRMAQDSGYRLAQDESQAHDMLLVVADSPQHDLFRAINRQQFGGREASGGRRVPVIFAHLDGAVARLFRVVPGATACFECLHHRMRVGKAFSQEFDAASSGNALWFEDVLPAPALQAQQLAATVMMQASLMLARSVHDLHENHLIELLAFNEMKRKSPVLKLPRCPACGAANNDQPMPPVYNPATV